MKTLSDIGEFGFIKNIPAQYSIQEENILGVGDDCSVVPLSSEELKLVTTDMLIENVHFLRDKISAQTLGYKALAVNFSDIAAMGGWPEDIYISIGLPQNIDVNWLEDLYAGMNELAQTYEARLMGGDTTSSPDNIVINILVEGRIAKTNIKYRSDANVGDIICVNKYIGDSAAGLKLLLNNIDYEQKLQYLVEAHNHPEPQIRAGQFLGSSSAVHAMLDVSDGIGSDIKHIMARSEVGARIELADLPLSDALRNCTQKYEWNAIDLAVNGGEDYCLLFTVDPEEFPQLKHKYEEKFKGALYKIGVVQANDYGLKYFYRGELEKFKGQGFDHFKK